MIMGCIKSEIDYSADDRFKMNYLKKAMLLGDADDMKIVLRSEIKMASDMVFPILLQAAFFCQNCGSKIWLKKYSPPNS